jgi:hypothetical protein
VRVLARTNRLEFHDDLPLDEKVQAVLPDLDTIVEKRHEHLPSMLNRALPELDAERRLVDRLDKPGTRLPVNLHGGADNPIRNIFVLKHFLPSSLPAFPRRRPMVTRISDTLGAHGIVG